MKTKFKISNRILSLVLALVLLVGMVPHFAVPAHAASNSSAGFTVEATYGECKYCEKNHAVERVFKPSVKVENGNVTITFHVSFMANGSCGMVFSQKEYAGIDTNLASFEYTITKEFSCKYSFSASAYSGDFGEDKPKLSYTIKRGGGHAVDSWTSNGNNQHTGTCSLCGTTVTENCSGGNATCDAKAVCSTCKNEYGDFGDHNWGDWTYSEDGKHILTCTLNDEHTDSGDCNNAPATCQADSACSVCGHVYEAKKDHSYTYTASGATITETCSYGCDHSVTATLTASNQIYTGAPITTGASIAYGNGWAGDTPQPAAGNYSNNTNADMATVTTTVEGKELTTTFQISAKELTSDMVTLSPATSNYTGESHNAPAYTLTYNDKALVADTDYTAGVWSGELLNAGEYSLVLTGKDNFTGSLTLTYTINPAELTNVKVKQSGELTYDSTAHTPEVTASATTVDNSEVTFTYSTAQDGTYGTMPSFTNAGEYTVYYKASAPNHKDHEGSFTVTIAPAEAEIVISENRTVTYDREPITAGTSNADILYSYNGDSTPEVKWYADNNGAKGAEIDAPTYAGTYWIGVSAPAGNYEAVEEVTAAVTIAKKEVAAPVIGSKAYTGEAQTAEIAESELYTVTTNEGGTNVGSYDVVLTLSDSANYKWTDSEEAAKKLTFQITQAQNSWITEPNVTDWTYGGGANIPTADAKFGTVTVEYRLQSGTDADYTTDVPTNAGKYYVRFSVPGTNDYAVLSEVKALEIAKAPLTVTAENKTVTYGDAAPTYTVTYSGFVGNEDALFLQGTLAFDCDYAQFSDKGEYTITPKGYESGNYDISYVDGTLTVKPKAITVTIADKTSVYGEEIVELTATDDGIVNNDENVYSLATAATRTSDVSEYAITGTALDANYDITFENGTYTITKAVATATAPTAVPGLTYNKGAQTLIAAGSTNDGNIVYSLEKDGEYTAELPKTTDAGTYYVWYKVIGDGNHTDSAPASIEVEIDKADPGIGAVTAGVINDTLETSAIVLTRANTDVDGNLTVDAGQSLAWGDNIISYTFAPEDTTNYKTVTGTVTVTVVDTIAPTGTVTVSTKSWAEFLNNITFGLFFKQTQTVSVSATDNLSGVAKIEYIESKTALELDAVKAAQQWTEMKNGSISVTLEDAKQFIYYIRITDKSGNIAYLSSDGAEYDTTAPVIEGVNNGATYYTTQAVTVTDKNIDTITLNVEAATGSITLEGNKEATYTIVATDKAGNSTTVTVKMAPIADITGSMEGKTDIDVTSDDKANLQTIVDTASGLLKDEDITAEEKAELEKAKADAEALIKVIEDTAAEQKAVTDKAAQFDEDAVKSTDKAELDELAEDIDALLDTNNLTQDERTALETLLEQVEGMSDTIDKTAADSKTATDAIGGLDPETVKSTDKAAIEKTLETVENLLDGDHLTEGQREALEDTKADAEALLDAIDEAAKAADTKNTDKVEDVTADNVTPEDKSDLEDAKADLEKALEDNSSNYTEEEKQAIKDKIDRIDDALEVIENVEAIEDAISDLPATVEPDDEETVAKLEDAKKAYDELTEYEKSLVDEETKKKLDDLTAAAVAYKIVKGDGGKWTKGDTSGLSFTANGPFGKFNGIEIDGKVLDPKHYSAKAGSTVITLKASYLETLSAGKHTFTVVYKDGEAEGSFKVNAKSVTPATGDDFNIMLYGSMLTMSLAALVVLLLVFKKRKHTN